MMKITSKKINNLNINIIKDDKFKFINIRVCFLSPLVYEDIEAYNILTQILTTRNGKYPAINLFKSYLEENYGMTLKGGFFNRGNIGIVNIISSSLNSKYSLGENILKEQIDTIKQCLFNPVLNDDVLNEIKTIYIEKLKDKGNKKTYILRKKVNALLGNDNPYGVNIEGDINTVTNITLDKINYIYNKLLTSECQIYICGNVDEEEVISLFGNVDLNSKSTSQIDLSYLKNIDEGRNVFNSEFFQSAVSLIYQCDIVYKHELHYALKVFLEMFNYDLFNIIREKHNYCYYIYAHSNNYLNTIEIVSEIESKNLDEIIRLISEILESYIVNFNQEQFEVSKHKIFTYLNNTKENQLDMIDLYFGFNFNKTVFSYEELYDKYKSVTKENIQEVVKMISLKIVSILKESENNE